MSLLHAIRNSLTPRGERFRRMRFGLARGARGLIDFQLDSAFYFGVYENELDEHFRRLVVRGTRCFDVGGYRGWDALCFAHLSRMPVVTFEPNPANVDYMGRALVHAAAPVKVVQSRVGDQMSEGVVTLDHGMHAYFTPDLVKIDIEGAEGEALRGASELLSTRKPALVIEVHSEACEAECVAILRGHAYVPLIVKRKKKLMGESRSLLHNRWIVCDGGPASGQRGKMVAETRA